MWVSFYFYFLQTLVNNPLCLECCPSSPGLSLGCLTPHSCSKQYCLEGWYPPHTWSFFLSLKVCVHDLIPQIYSLSLWIFIIFIAIFLTCQFPILDFALWREMGLMLWNTLTNRYTYFSSAPGKSSKVDHILGHTIPEPKEITRLIKIYSELNEMSSNIATFVGCM